MKPTVAIVTPGTFPLPSSRNSSVERVVIQVSDLLKDQVSYLIFGKRAKGYQGVEHSKGITFIRPQYRRRIVYLKKIARYLAHRHTSVIQVENRPRYAKYLKSKFPRRQVWLSLHSMTYISVPHIKPKELKRCLAFTDKIIVNSVFLKKKLLQLAPQAAKKIVVNYLGVNTKQFVSNELEKRKEKKEDLKSILGFEHKRVLLFVGRLLRIKGVHHIIKIMPDIIKQYPDTMLVIVGSAFYGKNNRTPYVTKLHQAAKPLANNIRFIPFVNYNEIQNWFLLADLVLVPSSENEAFGLVNVEAMATGVPVIAANSGGMKEIIHHDTTGLLIDPRHIQEEMRQGVLSLFLDDDKCRSMGEASIERVKNQFTWQHTADRYLLLYKQMMKLIKLE